MGRPVVFPMDGERAEASEAQSVAVRLLFAYCQLFGVDLRYQPAQKEFKGNLFSLKVLLRAIHITLLAVFATGKFLKFYEVFLAKPNIWNLVEATYFLNAFLIMAETQRTLHANEQFLQEFFRVENHKFFDYRRMYSLMVINATYVVVDVRQVLAEKTHLGLVTSVAAIFSWQQQTLYFLLHVESISTIYGKLRALTRLTKKSALLEEKAKIRADIARINSTFGNAVFFVCVKLFSFLYRSIIATITSHLASRWSTYMILCPVLQMLTLYDMAKLSTQVSDICHETAVNFIRAESSATETWKTYQLLKHDKARDNLCILSSFALHKGTFLKYAATVLTFIGIVGQFDYMVLDIFDHAKRAADHDNNCDE